MKIEHENIKYESSLPFKVFTFKARDLNRVIQPHWHQSTEILYCISGLLKINFPKKTYILHESQFIVINPNQIHSTKSLSENYVLCLELPLSFLNYVTNHKFMNEFIFDTDKCITSPVNSFEIINCFKNIITLHDKDEDQVLNNLDLSSNIYQLLRNLISKNSTKIINDYTGSNIDFAEKIITYLDKNYKNNVTLQEVANFCNYSFAYTSRMIKKNLGTSFYDLLTSIRLSKASTLIQNSHKSELNFESIAVKTGFKNYRNFYNNFQNTYHMSPGQYKTKIIEQESF